MVKVNTNKHDSGVGSPRKDLVRVYVFFAVVILVIIVLVFLFTPHILDWLGIDKRPYTNYTW